MIFVSLLHTFAEVALIFFLVRLAIAKWPDRFLGRMLTFTFG